MTKVLTENLDGEPVRMAHRSKSGDVTIILAERTETLYLPQRYQVWALMGHELLPCTRNFNDLDAARRYANQLWATR